MEVLSLSMKLPHKEDKVCVCMKHPININWLGKFYERSLIMLLETIYTYIHIKYIYIYIFVIFVLKHIQKPAYVRANMLELASLAYENSKNLNSHEFHMP